MHKNNKHSEQCIQFTVTILIIIKKPRKSLGWYVAVLSLTVLAQRRSDSHLPYASMNIPKTKKLFAKVSSVKFGGVASFGSAKVSNQQKFSPQKSYFLPIHESFLP